MEYGEHCAAVEREVAAIVDAFAAGPMNAPVPTCPDWTVADLADHIGGFTGFWTHVLCEGTGRPTTPFRPIPERELIPGWYADVGAHLVRELAATSGDQPVWTWIPESQRAAFVARRCAHELAIHRFDAQAARGTTRPIESGLAADGIEEIFVMIAVFASRGEDSGRGHGETLYLDATDGDAEWLVTLTPAGPQVERREGRASLALRGSASDLELLLYQRPPIGAIARRGDEATLEAWYQAFRFE